MLSSAEVTHVLPRFLDLGLPVHEQAVTRLSHVLTAPPALVGRQLVDFIEQVVASRCMPQQELAVAAREGLLAFMPQLLAKLRPLQFAARTARRWLFSHSPRASQASPSLGEGPERFQESSPLRKGCAIHLSTWQDGEEG